MVGKALGGCHISAGLMGPDVMGPVCPLPLGSSQDWEIQVPGVRFIEFFREKK